MVAHCTLTVFRLTSTQPAVGPPSDPCPVHTLPTELLREIFISVVLRLKKTTNLTYKASSGVVSTTDIHLPLSLSQTCHRWREIALDMPELWMALSNTVLDLQNKPIQVDRHLFLLFLERAKQLPLSVFLTADTRAANKLASHMDHVRILELIDFSDPCQLDLLVRPAPALEYLLITSSPNSSIFNPRKSMPQAPVLFDDSTSSLRALALFHPAFLPRQSFPMLTDLHVGQMSKPRLQDLLELLRGTPALQSLAITDLRIPVGFWLFGGQPQLAPTVPLARLRRLAVVRTPLTRSMALLGHLAVPRDVAVHLLDLLADRYIDPLVTQLPQLPPISAANTLEMVVCGNKLAFRARVLAIDGSVMSVPCANCTACWETYTYGWWKGLWQTLPCAQLTELRVAVDADDDDVLPRFLDAAIALTTLELRLHPRENDYRSGNRDQWREHASTYLDGAPRALLGVCALLEQELPVVCPFLAEFALIDASSTPDAWDGFMSGEDTLSRVSYVPDILCVIAARAAAGRRLRRVALQGRWSGTQRDRVRSAFGMGAAVTDLEFRELDAEASPLFEFEEDGEETWLNGHWTYELPKSTLPWARLAACSR